MGRLLKKRASSAKKSKKQESSSADAVQPGSDPGIDTKTAPAVVAVRESKKTSLTTRKAPVASRTETVGERNFLDKGLQFLREVKVELKKVAWPSRKQTIGSTVVVIMLVMIISLFLGVVDVGLSKIVRVVLQ